MFNNKYAYHSSVRKAIIAFGTLFNGVYIRRKDGDDVTAQTLAVPLSYGPKQKFIQRIQAAPTLDTGRATFEQILPHLGFEITGLTYDSARKLPATQQTFTVRSDGAVVGTYVSTPYNLDISLTAWAKNQDDGLQIVEQILPYFTPDFSVPVNDLPELGIKRDLQIVLNNVKFTDDYMGNADQRVAMLWEFAFTMKINLYGFVAPIGIIKQTIENIYSTLDGGQGTRITTTPDPADATADSNYDYIQQFDEIGIAP